MTLGFIEYFGHHYFGPKFFGPRFFDLPIPINTYHRAYAEPALRLVTVEADPAAAAAPNRLATAAAAIRVVTAEDYP